MNRSLLLLAPLCLAACNPPADEGLAAPPPGQGIQFSMTTTIAAGVEGEWCRFVQAPAEPLFVNRDEVRFGKGSHHFLLYETGYRTIPTAKEDGTPVDTSGVFDCSDGATNGWRITKLIGGSQNRDADSSLAFPSDVALKVEPGAVLLMNAHYIPGQRAIAHARPRRRLLRHPRRRRARLHQRHLSRHFIFNKERDYAELVFSRVTKLAFSGGGQGASARAAVPSWEDSPR
jgi:hypothetical protein